MLLALAFAQFAGTNVITGVGWNEVTTNGVSVQNSPTELPSQWSCLVGDNWVKMTLAAVCTLKQFHTNGQSKYAGSANIQFKCVTTWDYETGERLYFKSSHTAALSYHGSLWAQNYSIPALRAVYGGKGINASINPQTNLPYELENFDVTPSKLVSNAVNPTFLTSQGQKFCFINVNTLELFALATGNGPGGGGNSTASSATASVGSKVFGVSLYRGKGIKFLSTTVPHSQFEIIVDNEEFSYNMIFRQPASTILEFPDNDIPFGEYTLRARTKYSVTQAFEVEISADTAGWATDFQYGDVNQNNEITQNELTFIADMVGFTASSTDWWNPEYLVDGIRVCPADADMNEDGTVTSADVALAAGNAGVVGQ